MLLTGFYRSIGREVEVEQVLCHLAKREGKEFSAGDDDIPEKWREEIRNDIECPSCFITGAEVAKVSPPTLAGSTKRRWGFRYADEGGPSKHLPECDFVGVRLGKLPGNIVKFDDARTQIQRAVRELVARAMRLGFISYYSARNLREWVLSVRKESSILVTLDPRVPKWIQGMHRSIEIDYESLPYGVELTRSIVRIPGFDWRAAAIAAYRSRHAELLGVLGRERLWLHDSADRVQRLASANHGKCVLDPAAIRIEYDVTLRLASFISVNCLLIKGAPKAKRVANESALFAFAALLLFVSGWDLGAAINRFADIMNDRSSPATGAEALDFMSVNPFEDYEAWGELKRLQALSGFHTVDFDAREDIFKLERQLQAKFS